MDTEESNELVYHYTSLDAFISIVNSRTFRFGDARAMNDYTEIDHNINLLLNLEKQKPELMKELNISNEGFNKGIKNIKFFKKHIENHYIHIMSFSKNPDSLSQWRGYADNGTGICFSINLSALRHCLNNTYRIAGNCVYKQGELNTEAQNLLKLASTFDSDQFEFEARSNFLDNFIAFITTGKNEAFIDEGEVRLVSFIEKLPPPQDVKFINSNGFIKSYLEVSFRINIIDTIILGPCCKFAANDPVFNDMLDNLFFNKKLYELGVDTNPYKPKVLSSKATFR
ncbi:MULTISPECIES: DUF2971 domain-containing protein [unclassified Pseudoalteromonas]|uniref:DUF2971 domain-containing protein n=1 Tax=unclassified Pseudoalteromonas TaxID=194690 RepID=UPI00040E9EB0|nr:MULTISPECIES: DUF2971 domain-containing protein [unclassified Pseudoalteromonas]MBH0078691.1 DUF2971 domain-containing protein [Pseudoalteromonas sp. NZS11]